MPALSIDTTIDTTLTRTWQWGVELGEDTTYAGVDFENDWEHTFNLAVDKQYSVDSWTVEGSIVIDNPSSYDATITGVSNLLGGVGNTPVDCGVTFPYTLPAGQDLTCTFSATTASGAAVTNTAKVFTNYPPTGNSDTSNVTFPGSPTAVVKDSITVDVLGDTYPFNDDGGNALPAQYFACPADEGANTTTATINETGQSDGATVTLVCGDDTVALLTIENVTEPAGGLGFEYSFAPTLVDSWTTADAPADFIQPAGVAVDGAGNVYVSGYDNRVVIYDNDGNFIDQFGGPGSGPGQFDGPLSIAVDKMGFVFVVDSNNNRVQKFNSSGNHLLSFGSVGGGAGQLSIPIGLADSPSGLVYVADGGNNRVMVFTPNGNFVAAWGYDVKVGGGTGFEICKPGDTCKAGLPGNGDGQFSMPFGVAVDGYGNVYVGDSGNGRIQKFSKNGDYLTQWVFSGVTLLVADARGNVYAADSLGNRVHKFGSEGYFVAALEAPGEFVEPGNIAVDANNNLFIVDTGNARVQKYSQTVFFVDDGQSAAFTVEAGEYEISEIVPPGWSWVDIDCTGADDWNDIGHAITVTTDGPPDAIVCTFTNESDDPASDLDGVDDATENGAPNGGDGNNDGIPDSEQTKVASLSAASGYVTVEASYPPNVGLNDIEYRPTNTISDEPPTRTRFPQETVTIGVTSSYMGGATNQPVRPAPLSRSVAPTPPVVAQAFEISLFFEGNPSFDSYYKYGPTPDDPTDHWYEFLYDGQTGAVLLSDRIILHFVDGERGDGDLTINGQISDPGGPVDITEAELTIVKQVTGDTPADWSFAFTGDAGAFDLTDDDTDHLATALNPGDFDVTETNPPGWVTTSSCYPGGETGDESISVNLEGGESGTCYFVNAICFMGTYDNGSACVDAAAGHYTDTSGAADDIPCAPGSYQPSEGQPGCFLADANHYATGPAAIAQEECPVGTTSPEGSDSIDDCVAVPPTPADLTIVKVVNGSGAPADWSFGFTGDLGPFTLTDDDPDTSGSTVGDIIPTLVEVNETNPAGYATSASCDNGDSATDGNLSVTLSTFDEVSCTFTNTICQPGSYDTTDTWACTPAAAGYFVAGVGAAAQSACSPGTYQPATGAVQCLTADAGFYATGLAATAQTACPVGTTSPPGSDSIDDCVAVPPVKHTLFLGKTTNEPGYGSVAYFDWPFSDSNGGNPGDVTVAVNGSPLIKVNIDAGVYDITELVADGWDLQSVTCNSQPMTITDNTVSVDLTTEDMACVFHNVPEPPPPANEIFLSANAAGTTGDGLPFGSEDILMWDGTEWSLAFDGSAAGLVARKAVHNINAFYYGGSDDITLAFAQNRRYVPGIAFPIDGMDLVRWTGSSFSFVFDGSDVGLTQKTQEKIDGLHVLPGSAAPPALQAAAGGSCQSYLLISTFGPGKVPQPGGGAINFSGEDVLGFCATQLGTTTAGKWTMVLDGSAQGMPRNSTDSISTNADGTIIYLTTRGLFTVPGVTGGHSEVYAYNTTSHTFSGPLFSANSFGLPAKVDGLQYDVTP